MKITDPVLEQILNRIKTIDSRLDSLEKQVTFIGTEREILEDVRVSQASLKELILNHRTHIDNSVKDVKAEFIEQQLKTEEKLDETQHRVDDIKETITK